MQPGLEGGFRVPTPAALCTGLHPLRPLGYSSLPRSCTFVLPQATAWLESLKLDNISTVFWAALRTARGLKWTRGEAPVLALWTPCSSGKLQGPSHWSADQLSVLLKDLAES